MAGKQQKTAGNRKKSNSGRKTTTRKKTSEKNNKQSIELTPEEREDDSVKGYLTAEDVFERIKNHYSEVCKK